MTGGSTLGLAAGVFFRLVALALGIAVAYAAAGLGPIGPILLVFFLYRGRRPLARRLALAERRAARVSS